ncbi:AAA family ATPase [Vibrio splendidus]|uniref:AAA family ATPase n=1 Tax=Vibrio splendidus TaxID=29497 RepID=UPI000D37A86B|nr:AAA family ATPase [Vibrio splendidus]PTQ05479.1 hypothetical protein CWO28_11920 [Vibrio splendidus]
MKIKSISVEGLFGIFNHTVNFNSEDITIIIGENGLGKTVLLEILHNMFAYRFDEIKSVKFERISIRFTSGVEWLVQVIKDKKGSQLKIRNTEKSSNRWISLDRYSKHASDSRFEQYSRRNRVYFDNDGNGNEETSVFIDHEYEDYLFHRQMYARLNRKSNTDSLPNWFTDTLNEIKIDLIETQRILTKHGKNKEKYKSTIMDCAEDLHKKLNIYSTEVQNITTDLDSSFPNRVITKLNDKLELTNKEINEELNKLNERRKELSNVGLLTKLNIEDIQNLNKNEPSVLKFISLYIEDSKSKLNPYKDIYGLLYLFLKTTNTRLKHKKISACLNSGFKIQSTILKDEDDKPLEFSFEKLSSGEQHEIILFYKLIFSYEKGGIILIDEPELSLHISWQNNFIDDIKEIIAQNYLSIVIATHSPDLIGQHWNLTQELTGVDE